MDEQKITSPIKAIRAYCLGCCYGSSEEVKQCTIEDCELYPFRFGKNPYHTVKRTEEQKAACIERLQLAREVRKKMVEVESSSTES